MNFDKFLDKAIKNGEDEHIEFKEAKNDFPKDALETISAFANTDGGYLILGVKEIEDGKFEAVGVKNIDKVKSRMYDLLLQPKAINYNPIDFNDVKEMKYKNKDIDLLIVPIPKMSYSEMPIFLKDNDRYTYRRIGRDDYLCDRKTIEMMIRDSLEISFDSKIIKGFSINDFDIDTINEYRYKFEKGKPEHPFNKLSNIDFLIKINALRQSRQNSDIEPTVAGLLVFGKHTSIKEYLPHYNVEYISKKGNNKNYGFIDRLIYDGTWGEDNLYNFFNKTADKLYLTVNESSEILSDSITRKSSSKFKIAIREALVNSIIHCDYQVDLGIVITRYSDNITFKNGGSLRISKLDFFKGEHSKPRNYYIQEIFRLVNLCEKAGSGVPKIMEAVEYNKYRYPSLITEIDKFEFTLWDTSIIDSFDIKNEIERNILEFILAHKTATVNEIVNNLNIHRNTSYKYLNQLKNKGILYQSKIGNKYVYMININKDFAKYSVIEVMYSMIDVLKNHM